MNRPVLAVCVLLVACNAPSGYGAVDEVVQVDLVNDCDAPVQAELLRQSGEAVSASIEVNVGHAPTLEAAVSAFEDDQFFAVQVLAMDGSAIWQSDPRPISQDSNRVVVRGSCGSGARCLKQADGSILCSPPGDLTIESFRRDGLLCYEVSTLAGAVVSSNCPATDPPDGDVVFGESAQNGNGWFAVVWILPAAEVVKTSDVYVRSEGGWTVFQASQSGLFWFDVRNMGATFHCKVEFAWVECSMTEAPTTT